MVYCISLKVRLFYTKACRLDCCFLVNLCVLLTNYLLFKCGRTRSQDLINNGKDKMQNLKSKLYTIRKQMSK